MSVPSAEWIKDCHHWRGRVLTGEHAHWCFDWDELPIDETCDEWPCRCGFHEEAATSERIARGWGAEMSDAAKIAADVVAEARKHLGQREATGHNDGPFVERVLGGERGLAWCAAFALRCYEWSGHKLPVNFWACRRVSTLYAELDERGAVLSAHDFPAPGDLAFWLGHTHASAGPSGHVGVVVETGTMTILEHDKWRTVRTIDVVEGNSGNAVRLRRYLHGEPGQPTAFARPSKVLP